MAKRVDMSKVPMVVELGGPPNPQNPCSQMSPERRESAMRDLVRRIAWRLAEEETQARKPTQGGP